MIRISSFGRLWTAIGCSGLLWIVGLAHAAEQSSPGLNDRIGRLIEALGSDQFATRERAQVELERLGVAAFDALHEARENPDIEVAHRVRQLLLGMRVVWARESDSAEVKRVLHEFGQRPELERRSRADRLALLEQGEGIEPLCRIARFDAADGISKYAAILVMNYKIRDDEAAGRQVADKITESVEGSRRPATAWLRAYAHSIVDPAATIPEWQKLTQAELASMDQSGELGEREIARDLLRWYAEFLHRQNRVEESFAVIRQTLTLMDGTREQLLDAIDWLVQREAYSMVSELAARYPERFEEMTLLKYRLAEAQLKQGQTELAETTAREASERRLDEPKEHIEAAEAIRLHGLYDWAEREWRLVIDRFPDTSPYNMEARCNLSEMLHDLRRYEEAGTILEAIVRAMDEDRGLEAVLAERVKRDPSFTRSRTQYFFAQHHASKDEWDKTREHLEKGIEADPTDADVLIAMYRVPNASEEWKEKTLARIQWAEKLFRLQVARLQHEQNQTPEIYDRSLALACNQLAWLVSNTEGNFEEAVKLSHLSLELVPDQAGYLDTLGRCYYAKKDYENAVRYQSRAARLEPHTQQIQRQLQLFEEALKASQAAETESDGN